MNSKKYNGNGSSWEDLCETMKKGNPYPGLGGIPNDTTLDSWSTPSDVRPSDTPVNNFFGVGTTIPTSNIYSRVNVEQVASLFSSALRFRMPSSVRLITIHGSEVFIPNDVFEMTNIALILSIKGQLEDGIFKHDNNDVLDVVYMPQNGLTPDSYYIGYTSPVSGDMRAVSAMTQAATRLIAIFKDLGIDLTSDLATNKAGGIRLRDIFMSAYVLCMQIIIMYNTKRDDEKADKLRNMTAPTNLYTAGSNISNKFGMPAKETNIEAEHKPIFDGVKPDKNGMFNIEFDRDSDEFTDMIEAASSNSKEVE